ncbi:MAG: ribonuclease T2 [Hyphomicrobiaceae bacterium]|nr:ribonuclease T2 [Hyphomicrobiaceae bacterium]
MTSTSDAQRWPNNDRDTYDRRDYDRRDGGSGSGGRQSRERNIPGEFDYYALVLSWSPTHCESEAGRNDRDALQCGRRDGRRYAFVLHGLWPQYERGFPGNCRTRERPFVPNRVIDEMLDIMPARGLVIHEYKKHGTCSGLDPAGYYEMARRLYNRIRIPERYTNPFEAQFVAPEQLTREIVAANPGLEPNMMAVSCAGPGNRLREIRICYTKSGQLRPCGSNENQRRMCSARQMYVPPVRSTWKPPAGASQRPGDRAAPVEPRRGEPPRGNVPRDRDYLPAPRGI